MKIFLLKLIAYFRQVNIYQSKKNNKKIFFRNLKLLKFNSIHQVKFKKIKLYLKNKNLIHRFSEGSVLFVLKKKNLLIGLGWQNSKKLFWDILEIRKKILFKNKIILFDFFIFNQYRKKGYYSKMLFLIKNQDVKRKFIIYALKTNKNSIRGILKANFRFKTKIKKNIFCDHKKI